MFDLSRLRVLNLDQLQSFSLYRLTQPLRSVAGREFPAGEQFAFDFAILNANTGDAELHMLTATRDEVLFATRAWEHRHCFESIGREVRPAAPPTQLAKEETVSPEAWTDWLAAQPGLEAAVEVLRGGHGQHWGAARQEGDILLAAARSFLTQRPALARWLAAKSLDCYHAWMSQATSGGEGMAMQDELRRALDEARQILSSAAAP